MKTHIFVSEGDLGALLGRFGAVLGASWGDLGAILGRPRAILRDLGAILRHLGPSWGDLRGPRAPRRRQYEIHVAVEGALSDWVRRRRRGPKLYLFLWNKLKISKKSFLRISLDILKEQRTRSLV